MELTKVTSLIKDVPDFPKEGIIFKDITPIFSDSSAFQGLIKLLSDEAQRSFDFDKLVCVESRGFILGSALALHMNKPFILVRKPGKLPGNIVSESYELEYGTDSLELISNSIVTDERLLIVDDILATGGTLAAVERLCLKAQGKVVGSLCFMELGFLEGASKLSFENKSLLKL